MKVGIITQARMTSTRLPGKVMLTAAGRPLLDIHLDRLGETGLPVIVATTANAADDPIARLAGGRDLAVFRGSEEDVLGRFAGAAEAAGLDAVVRVTSDCPLLDPEVISAAVRRFEALGDPDAYVSNVIERTFPRGLDVEVFSTAALTDANASATDPSDREHVTPYLYSNRSGRTTLHSITRRPDASRHRITLDTSEDLIVIRTLIEDHDAARLDTAGLVAVLDAHPELTAINAHVEQKKVGG